MKTYSVVITHYNREHNLKNTLIGLDLQTLPPTEVIVVDLGDGISITDNFGYPLKIVQFYDVWQFIPLAAARNLGAEHSSTENLIFLDVDCIPSANFCEKMLAASVPNNALAMGSPRYMLTNKESGADEQILKANSILHPCRPVVHGIKEEKCYELFWSLCFSISTELFEFVGGFDDHYEGYGAEDTDFALEAKRAGVAFYLADAEVYHQQHPIYVPPLNHLQSIVKNSNRFFIKWGYWPMIDCLTDFTNMGYIDWNEERQTHIVMDRKPTATEIEERLLKNAPYR